jgi:hypothetical protein
MNLYELLGVSARATPREIKKSYRRLLSSDGISDEQFAVIENAYATLIDAHLRHAYDDELKSESVAPQLRVPLTVPHPEEVGLVEPIAESPKLVDNPTTEQTTFPETDIVSSSPRPSSKRQGRQANANPLRTFISCVAAALAAGPIAILILKFVFDKDPLNLWEEPPPRVVVRQPIDPGNLRGPATSPTTPDKDNSNGSQRSLNPPNIEPEKPPQAAIPLPPTTTSPDSDTNIPPPQRVPNPSNDTTSEPNSPNTLPTPPSETAEVIKDLRMPVPTDKELENSVNRLTKFFRGEYDRAKMEDNPETQNVALFELAEELFKNGKLVMTKDVRGAINNDNRIERYAWFRAALNITIESGDTVQAKQICVSLSSEYQIEDYELNNEITLLRFNRVLDYSIGKTSLFLDAWKLLFQNSLTNLRISIDAGNKTEASKQLKLTRDILKQLHPTFYLDSEDRARLNDTFTQLFDVCISNSKELIQNGHFELALEVLDIARNIAISGGGKDEEALANKIISQYARFPRLEREFDAARLNYDKSPNDPDINSALAIYLILVRKNWSDGLFFLAHGQDATLAEIAKADNRATAAAIASNTPVSPPDEMKLAEQWRKLYKAKDRDINRKEITLGRTKFWYEQTIPDLTPLQKLGIEEILTNLSNDIE